MNSIGFIINVGLVFIVFQAHSSESYGEVLYSFRYSIDEAGVILQHWERRTQDIVHGSYSFVDADGRVRVVEYEVNGPKGFRAVVHYRKPPGRGLEGHLKYPHDFHSPVKHAEPIGYISEELFGKHKTYPNIAV